MMVAQCAMFADVHISIREAEARFSEAIAAAMRGERVVITRYGQPVAELTMPSKKEPLNFAAADEYLAEIGWKADAMKMPDDFNSPAFSREVLGIDD
ncbi:MAG: type II toxin-antitoxin system Phd/YefM family antitoxin [Blastomonas sp.]